MEHAPAFGAFPVNDLGYGLLTANPRLVALGVEIEDVALSEQDAKGPLSFKDRFRLLQASGGEKCHILPLTQH